MSKNSRNMLTAVLGSIATFVLCKFFTNNELQLTAVAGAGAVFTGWSDGSTENPHKVTPSEGLNISAQFR